MPRFPVPDTSLPIGLASKRADEVLWNSSHGMPPERFSSASPNGSYDDEKNGRPISSLRLACLAKPPTVLDRLHADIGPLAAATVTFANLTSTTNLYSAGAIPAAVAPSSVTGLRPLFVFWKAFVFSAISEDVLDTGGMVIAFCYSFFATVQDTDTQSASAKWPKRVR
ncbi:hypothetical protein EVAR_2306_1 [Eumeta japonica]|uniref:Uncharacterized protein n=1 Tax=Eumeta variegata TaxID=151549 RepID=A0A4C1SFY0_EUMVA|nr:hypothetical protein EVAR_2306_1 [Eumeta japonica]